MVDTDEDIAKTLAMFGGFTEGLQLFASFAMLMNFPRHNKMKGMGQIVSWSVRDESLHCEGVVKLYHAFNAETGAVTKAVADDIVDCCKTVVGLEDKFIDLAFEAGEIQGMTPDDIKKYNRSQGDQGNCAARDRRRARRYFGHWPDPRGARSRDQIGGGEEAISDGQGRRPLRHLQRRQVAREDRPRGREVHRRQRLNAGLAFSG